MATAVGFSEPRAVVVIGKTGSGKSALCNRLTNSDFFPEGRGFTSKTKHCSAKKALIFDRIVTVVDTPGTADATDKEAMNQELPNALKFCPEGIDAFLVAMVCNARLTDEAYQAVEDAINEFGPECYKRAIIVFTNGDVYNNEESEFLNELNENRKTLSRLDAMLKKFNERWVLADNGKKCDSGVRQQQLNKLLDLVDSVAILNTKRYSMQDLQSLNEAKEKRKDKIRALQRDLKELEKEVSALRLQRMGDKLEGQKEHHKLELQALKTEHEMREKVMQMAVLFLNEKMTNHLQLLNMKRQIQEMELQQLLSTTQVMIENGDQRQDDSSCCIL